MSAQQHDVVALLVAFALAVVSASVALLVRCRDRGRAFGSPASSRWAVAVIVMVAAGSAAAGVFLVHRGVPAPGVYYFALAAPVVSICGRMAARIPRGDPGDGPKIVPTVLSLGALLLLDRLDSEMSVSAGNWTQHEPRRTSCWTWSSEVMDRRGGELYYGLYEFVGDNTVRRAAIQRNYRDLVANLAKADNQALRGGDQARRNAHHKACHAYLDLRRQAYLWRYDPGASTDVDY